MSLTAPDAPAFLFVADHPAIDFANTAPVSHGAVVEGLVSTESLLLWVLQIRQIGAIDADRLSSQPPPRDLLKDAVSLRETLRSLFQSVVDRQPPTTESLSVLNRFLLDSAPPAAAPRLNCLGPNHFRLITPPAVPTWTSLLPTLALQAAQLLASPAAQHIKRCENPACVLFFLDTSKNKSRRWCSMSACGNRHKVAAHYRRQRRAGGT